jgi:cytoskeletal protein CcmA (bactofilin family)
MGMFTGGKKTITQGAVDSVIGEKAKFKGELITEGAVSVSGQFEGKLVSDGEIIIGRGSRITGDIEGVNVVVSGKVNGNIVAAQNLEITKTGRVDGDLVGGKITIEEGSSYHGRVSVNASGDEEEIVVEDEPAASESKRNINQTQFFKL